MAAPIDGAQLRDLRQAYLDSTLRFGTCACGHSIDRAEDPCQLMRRRGKWYVSVSCTWSYCGKCGRYDPVTQLTTGVPCKGSTLIVLGDNYASSIPPRHPRHRDTLWRDRAEILPRFDGTYAYTMSKSGGLLKTPSFNNRCLFFYDSGVVHEVAVGHRGHEREFQESARSKAPRIDISVPPGHCRGIYQVDGRNVTCTLTEFDGNRYGYTGTISADGSWIRLKRTDARGRKGQLISDDYTFHPIDGLPPLTTPAPPPMPVNRTGLYIEPPDLPDTDPPFRFFVGDAAAGGRDAFDVVLESPGRKFDALHNVIKALTPASYTSRAAARRVFDNAPSLIMRNVDAETAAKAKSRLERAGATASFRPGPAPAVQPVPAPVQPVQPVPVQPAAPDPGPAFASFGTAAGDLEGNPPGGAPAVTQELFDVVLESAGRRQIHVIKAIREASPAKVGLSEAKSLADNVPSLILRQVDQETAARAKSLLEAAGATITVRPGAR